MKGFFYLLLNQLSTMQEIIKGDKKKMETGFWRTKDEGKEGGRQKEREKEGKHYSSVPSKHEMLGYFNKKPTSIREKRNTEDQREGARERQFGNTHKAGKRKVKALNKQLSCDMTGTIFCLGLHTYMQLLLGMCLPGLQVKFDRNTTL